MSKTNHFRNFEDYRLNIGQRINRYTTWSGMHVALDGQIVAAGSTVASENSRSVARDKRGAKKYVHSRGRFHDKMGLQKIVKNLEDEI